MESDLAGDYSDEISKGNWMRQPLSFPFDNFKYKIFREIVSEQTRKRVERWTLRNQVNQKNGAGVLAFKRWL